MRRNPSSSIVKFTAKIIIGLWILFALCFAFAVAHASPQAHRTELTRSAHAVWGLNAPVPVFAAQITQESGWNTAIKSPVGAVGMAQFMPATAKWWCKINNLSAVDCQPANPTWAMRALVGYDLWLYNRVWGLTEYDRIYAALRAYNGGLGHWQMEAQLAQNRKLATREQIDAKCGKAKRHISHCAENLNYPKRILDLYQPRFAGWGRVIARQA